MPLALVANRFSHVPALLAETVQMGVAAASRTMRNWQARREIRALAECDAYLLNDIGLTHSDVTAALDGRWNDDPSLHLKRVAAGRGHSSRSL